MGLFFGKAKESVKQQSLVDVNVNNNETSELYKIDEQQLNYEVIDADIYENKYDELFKIIMLGGTNVGKTQFIHHVIGKEFDGKKTIGIDFYEKMMMCGDKMYKFQLWDMAGNGKSSSIISAYCRGSCACIIMFDMTNKESYFSLELLIHEFYSYCNYDCLLFIVGNNKNPNDSIISTQEATFFAEKQGAIFMEIYDAKSTIDVFKKIAKNVIKTRKFTKKNYESNCNCG